MNLIIYRLVYCSMSLTCSDSNHKLKLETTAELSGNGVHSLLNQMVVQHTGEPLARPRPLSEDANVPEGQEKKQNSLRDSKKDTKNDKTTNEDKKDDDTKEKLSRRNRKPKKTERKVNLEPAAPNPGQWALGTDSLFSASNMQELLDHPPGSQLFHDFLKRIYCEENILFIEAIDAFKDAPSEKKRDMAQSVSFSRIVNWWRHLLMHW